MIGRLRGELISSDYTSCVVECGGVGYDVAIPLSSFDKLPQVGEECILLIHTHVREDAIVFFGFSSDEERKLFRSLINVSGIGGKMALNILSALPVATFCGAIANGDVKLLSRISGIGKRTAECLIVELKEKLGALGAGSATPGANLSEPTAIEAVNDAALALETLGFKRDSIDNALKKVIADLPESDCNSETLLRKALVLLNF